ncbi:MAG: hypothetical protein ACTSQ5_07200 [Promethearchaeota archaeon]
MENSIKEIMKVFANESQSGIITQIITFGSLNLKLLAKMINKSESTTLGHVKKLIEIDYIELDKDESESRWGKFYKITKKTLNAIQNMDNMGDRISKSTGDVKKDMYIAVSRMLQALSSWPKNVIYYTGVFMEEHADELLSDPIKTDENIDELDVPIKTDDKIYFMNPPLSIKTKEEWFEFKEIMKDFSDKIMKFQDINAPMTQYLSLISVPIPDIHPIKEKRYNPFNKMEKDIKKKKSE